MRTVREHTFNLLRQLDLTHVVGNPGSTEGAFLDDFPSDFTYIMALQEASVVAIADGLSQGLNHPVLVNVHSAVGIGNAMGNIITAFLNKTPLIITAGQQTREMLLMEPFLTNKEATLLPKPWVKWSYEITRPEDVAPAFMRAYTMATQEPAGPVFLSIPMDLWDYEIDDAPVLRQVSQSLAPDPYLLEDFAQKINQSNNPVLIVGAEITRSGAWQEIIQFAERIESPVWHAPFSELSAFPEDHRLYQGDLPPAKGPLANKLMHHDLVIVIGAPVFRYYPWVPGDYLPQDTRLIQVINDPYEAAKSPVGDCLVSNSRLALLGLLDKINKKAHHDSIQKKQKPLNPGSSSALNAQRVFDTLSPLTPKDYIVINESPSNVAEFRQSSLGTITKPNSYYFTSSGGLGWAMPSSVGLALAEQYKTNARPVLLIIGDGSFNYSVQAIWTAVQHKVHLIIIALRNQEYAILKSFALLEQRNKEPGLDLPGLDLISLAKGYGAEAYYANTTEEIESIYTKALNTKGVTVIQIAIEQCVKRLL